MMLDIEEDCLARVREDFSILDCESISFSSGRVVFIFFEVLCLTSICFQDEVFFSI